MNATNRNCAPTAHRQGKLALPSISNRKNATSRNAFGVLGGLLLTSFLAHAASVTVNLGPSAQNFTETGIGPNTGGLGQWFLTLGACTPVGGNTTCILSGSFTGTAPGLTS